MEEPEQNQLIFLDKKIICSVCGHNSGITKELSKIGMKELLLFLLGIFHVLNSLHFPLLSESVFFFLLLIP